LQRPGLSSEGNIGQRSEALADEIVRLARSGKIPILHVSDTADPNVTAQIYSHALPADDERSADTWDAIIKGPVQ
jgi:hypothetical protein